jgi:hypothetical protein
MATLFGAPAGRTATPALPICSWPFEATGTGLTNIATPDTNATYWIMPFDTRRWTTMTIQGKYPQARFFNFTSYTATGAPLSTILDAAISPDPGTTNPFATASLGASGTYTVAIGAGTAGSTNLLKVGGSRLVFVVYRIYASNFGFDRTGGAGVPDVSLVASDGSVQKLQPCPFAAAESSLGNMIGLLAAAGFADAVDFLEPFLEAAKQHISLPITGTCTSAVSGSSVVAFGPPTLNTGFFPDPPTTYSETPGLCPQAGRVLVVRGRAPVFPNTYLGGSVFQPAFDGQVQVRYWSLCNNDEVIPYPVIACLADFQTKLGADQFYTDVLSTDPAPPTWLAKDVNWLPWGDTNVPKNLIFRNTLPATSASIGSFQPTGVFCDPALFITQGWQGCFAAAGISPAATQ